MPAMVEDWIQTAKDAVQDAVQNAASAHVWKGTTASTLSTAVASTMPSSMPSVRTLSKLAFGGAGVILGGGQTVLGTFSQSCPNPQLSCHNTTVVENLCCFNAPGGQLLLTQFWDTDPVTGPEDSWTIHGLWPDRCDGSFEANCDPSREYTNISAIIKSFGKDDLLNDMETYWKDYKGNDDSFWSHEWGKHGTCISTMEPECYDEHKATEEVVDFFQKTVDLFKELPSYKWLEEAGITPSDSETYTTDAIQAALSAKRPGVEVTLGCKSGRLNEIWYHYDVRGPVQTGEFVPANPDGPKSSCPKSGIKYLPKNGGGSQPKPTGTKPTTGVPTSTSAPGTPFSGRGTLNVQVDGSKKGCIISAGTWYTSGTCATFTATSSDSGFTLQSSKGPCGVVGGALTCASKVPATTFTAVDGKLAAGGNAAWSSNKVASGTTQQKVYAGADHDAGFEIVWG